MQRTLDQNLLSYKDSVCVLVACNGELKLRDVVLLNEIGIVGGVLNHANRGPKNENRNFDTVVAIRGFAIAWRSVSLLNLELARELLNCWRIANSRLLCEQYAQAQQADHPTAPGKYSGPKRHGNNQYVTVPTLWPSQYCIAAATDKI